MRKIIASLLLLFALGYAATAQFAIFQAHSSAQVIAITYLITDSPFNATCNGIADDSASFTALNVAAVAWDAANPGVPGDILINIPNSTCMVTQMGQGVQLVRGIINHRVRVVGLGPLATISDDGTGGGLFLGAGGEYNDDDHHATIQTVSSGATSVTLTACPGGGCSDALALFTVGQWARVSGLAQQSDGYPSNPAFWDYVLVTAKTATDIQFTPALTHEYKSTWYKPSTSGRIGGPATIYALHPSWPVNVEYDTLILDQTNPTGDGSSAPGKTVTMRNLTVNSVTRTTCGVPSQNMVFTVINSDYSACNIEVDKIIDNFITQGSTFRRIDFTSASVKNLAMSDSNVTVNLGGNAINTTIANSTLAEWDLGTRGFGAIFGQTVAIDTDIAIFSWSSATSPFVNLIGTWSGGVLSIPKNMIVSAAADNGSGAIRLTVNSTSNWTTGLVGGGPGGNCNANYTITVIDATHIDLDGSTYSGNCTGQFGNLPGDSSFPWAVPGANIYFGGSKQTLGPVMQVLDLTEDSNFVYITTSFPGAFPTMALPVSGAVTATAHPAPQFTCRGCTGDALAVDLNGAPELAPFGSYSSRVITSANGNPASPTIPPVWGELVSVTMTPTTVYTGTALSFSFYPCIATVNTTGMECVTYNPTINAKIGGARILLPTSHSGTQSGDSIPTDPGAGAWLIIDQNYLNYVTLPGDIGSTSVTVEIITDQGVVNP